MGCLLFGGEKEKESGSIDSKLINLPWNVEWKNKFQYYWAVIGKDWAIQNSDKFLRKLWREKLHFIDGAKKNCF